MTLEEYMTANDITATALAEKLGCNKTTVTRWRKGETRPDDALALKLAAITSGLVTPNDFYNLPAEAA